MEMLNLANREWYILVKQTIILEEVCLWEVAGKGSV